VSSIDGRKSILLLTLNEHTKQAECFEINGTTGTYTSIFQNDTAYSYPVQFLNDISTDQRTIVFVAEKANRTPNIYASSDHGRDLRQLTDMNPELDRVSYGRGSLIEWGSVEGEVMQGAVLLPPDYQKGKRYPLIVYQYPHASLSDSLNQYDCGLSEPGDYMHLLSTRGYVVLFADSSSGPRTPMADIANSVLPGINKLIALGIADPDRLGVMGHSYGGYGVLSLLVQTRRFKAAVAKAPGSIDRIFQYGNMSRDGSSIYVLINEAQMGGTPWERRDRYIENSPFFYLDRVQTPLLIIQGTNDPATPDRESDELFVALRRLGKEVEYAKYEGEGHVLGRYADEVDYLNRMILWFDKYLKDGPALKSPAPPEQ